MPTIIKAPSSFDGTIETFYENYTKNILISPEVMEWFHTQLVNYLQSGDPLYLVRQVKKHKRGTTILTKKGFRVRPTDNSPAWWLHYQLFTGEYVNFSDFETLIESIPCHIFDLKINNHISQAGWHVAHIFEAKDRNTDIFTWNQQELTKRMVRSIHPCNYFYIAKQNWQHFGGEPQVISFFYERFKEKYHTIWDNYLSQIGSDSFQQISNAGKFVYRYPKGETVRTNQALISPIVKNELLVKTKKTNCSIQYEFSRLCFKADLIEPLDWDDVFCVITKDGDFRMSKQEFYESFPNVVNSVSYREKGIYHYPKTPEKALRFMLD